MSPQELGSFTSLPSSQEKTSHKSAYLKDNTLYTFLQASSDTPPEVIYREVGILEENNSGERRRVDAIYTERAGIEAKTGGVRCARII